MDDQQKEDLFAQFDWENDELVTPPEHPDSDHPVPPRPPAAGPDGNIESFEDWVVRTEAETEHGRPSAKVIPLTREDLHNATYLVSEFGKNVRFNHHSKRWLIWHKGQHHWREDKVEAVKYMAVQAGKRRVDDAFMTGNKDAMKIAMSLFSLTNLNRALDAMKFFPGVSTGDDDWDQQLDLFCVANGVIDLRTGAIRPGLQTDHITKASMARYDPMALCPKWETFLKEVFVDDDLIEYVRTIVGYCMTGYTVEQIWFLLYGTGGNGKSVFMSILRAVFGLKEYFEVAAEETFVKARWQSGSHNVAQLKRARLVMASEVPDRAMFDSQRIKALTGNEPVTAKALYENPSSFIPQLKLMMMVNHLPDTKDDTKGFWRRLRTIPFEVSFIGHENTHLVDDLLTELPGILNWCVSGAVTWFTSGLADEPTPASDLRTEYQAESDPLSLFINDCIVETGLAADTIAAREMYRVYVAWCSGTSHEPVTETNFGRTPAMTGLGLGKKKTEKGAVYVGVKVYEPGDHAATGVMWKH